MHCNASWIFCSKPWITICWQSQQMFIWRSVNIKFATCAATQDAALARRRHTQSRSWESQHIWGDDAQSLRHTPRHCMDQPSPHPAVCLSRSRCGWKDRTAADEQAPAGADANEPIPLLSEAFLLLPA